MILCTPEYYTLAYRAADAEWKRDVEGDTTPEHAQTISELNAAADAQWQADEAQKVNT